MAKISLALILPAVVTGCLLAVAWRLWRVDEDRQPAGAGGLALGAGFATGFALCLGAPLWPGSGVTPTGLDWTLLGVLALALVALVREAWLANEKARWISWCAAGLFSTQVISNSAETVAATLVLLVPGLVFLVWSAERVARQEQGAASPLALSVSAGGLALVAGLSGSLLFAQLAAALAASLVLVAALAWWRPRLSLKGGGVETAVFALVALGLNAHYFSDTRGSCALLLAASLATPLLARAGRLEGARGRRRALLIFALALLPVALAAALAYLDFEPNPYG
ncbi:MAG: hypothetical protein ABGY71_05125 [bacterium]|nr:hypothetical protein [Planctomycetota bacterium]HIL53250.1 hypothetical protein [Planctomycetota bacterium]